MRSHRKIVRIALLAAISGVLGMAITTLPDLGGRGAAFIAQERTSKSENEKRMPVALYSSLLPTDPTQRAIRLARGGRYDKRYSVPFDELDPASRGRGIVSDWYVNMSALPAGESDLIILGNVVGTAAYVSNDKTGAYSEFTVRVDDVLGRDGFPSTGTITALREGANVELPSGRILRYEIVHQGMPTVGQRYLLFLKYNEHGNDYTILTGYELRESRVYPLDEVAPFMSFNKSDERTFLTQVRAAAAEKPDKRRLNQ